MASVPVSSINKRPSAMRVCARPNRSLKSGNWACRVITSSARAWVKEVSMLHLHVLAAGADGRVAVVQAVHNLLRVGDIGPTKDSAEIGHVGLVVHNAAILARAVNPPTDFPQN